MSEEPLVVVDVDESVKLLVLQWAFELGGVFQEESW